MKNRKLQRPLGRGVLLSLCLILSILSVKAQIKGQIFSPATGTGTALDPNRDGYVTSSGLAYPSNEDELLYFENEWHAKYQLSSEPIGDASTGKTCSQTDIVDVDGDSLAYFIGIYDPDGYPTNSDGDEYFLGRLRIGKDPGSGNFGYSILIDIDLLYGSSDLNAVTGNQGFEVEIRLVNGSGSKGVFLDDVDGTTAGTTLASYSFDSNHCKSYANYTNALCISSHNSPNPVFVDVAIPFSDLTTHFGLTPTSKVRIAAATSTNGTTVLGSNGSDLAGVDDNNYASFDAALGAIIADQPTSPLPVELIYFAGNKDKENVNLEWATATEINNSHFVVEHSMDGRNFYELSIIDGKRKSFSIREYQYIHYGAGNAVNYYRLKQVDYNGDMEYSPIVVVSPDGKTENGSGKEKLTYNFKFRPGTGEVEVYSREDKGFELTIINGAGQEVFRQVSGGETINGTINSLKPGFYLARCSGNGKSETFKFLIP